MKRGKQVEMVQSILIVLPYFNIHFDVAIFDIGAKLESSRDFVVDEFIFIWILFHQ